MEHFLFSLFVLTYAIAYRTLSPRRCWPPSAVKREYYRRCDMQASPSTPKLDWRWEEREFECRLFGLRPRPHRDRVDPLLQERRATVRTSLLEPKLNTLRSPRPVFARSCSIASMPSFSEITVAIANFGHVTCIRVDVLVVVHFYTKAVAIVVVWVYAGERAVICRAKEDVSSPFRRDG